MTGLHTWCGRVVAVRRRKTCLGISRERLRSGGQGIHRCSGHRVSSDDGRLVMRILLGSYGGLRGRLGIGRSYGIDRFGNKVSYRFNSKSVG